MPGDNNVSPSLSNKKWVNAIPSNSKQCDFPLPIIVEAVWTVKKPRLTQWLLNNIWWLSPSILTDKVISKMSMRDSGRMNMWKSSMASSQEMIEGRVAGIDGKLLYHRGKSEEKGKNNVWAPCLLWRFVWSQWETDS